MSVWADTPWDCHICQSVGVVWGIIYGSPMECLGQIWLSPLLPLLICPRYLSIGNGLRRAELKRRERCCEVRGRAAGDRAGRAHFGVADGWGRVERIEINKTELMRVGHALRSAGSCHCLSCQGV